MRRDEGQDSPRLKRMFALRDTENWTSESRYLSHAAKNFGVPWSNLGGAILFPNMTFAMNYQAEVGKGFVTAVWTDERS